MIFRAVSIGSLPDEEKAKMFGFQKRRDNRRIRDLEEGQESLERHVRGLRADMDLQWEKVQRLFSRIAKRSAMIEQATAEADSAGSSNPPADESDSLDFLTPRQRALNAMILAERRKQ